MDCVSEHANSDYLIAFSDVDPGHGHYLSKHAGRKWNDKIILFLSPCRIQRAAVTIRPATLLKFHDILKKRKYRLLYSSGSKRKPGPKGPSRELIQAIVELKRRNPRFGCPRIAQQINNTFGIDIDKDVSLQPITGRILLAVGPHG